MFSSEFLSKLNTLFETIITDRELPEHCIHLYSNISRKTDEEISKSICIYEPDYPPTKTVDLNNLGKNLIVLNLRSGDFLEMLMRPEQLKYVPLPESAHVKVDKTSAHIYFDWNDSEIFPYIKKIILDRLSKYRSKASSFGCCSSFMECSDAKHCVHENKLYSTACTYRKHLDSGEIFYGNNRNV